MNEGGLLRPPYELFSTWPDSQKDISLPSDQLIIMIQREDQSIVPNGTTSILENDILVTIQTDNESFEL